MSADGGCNHSLRGAHQKCSGVEGSYGGHIFAFNAGQLATLDSFQQRCTLLSSAGILKNDPMYVDKTRCLPRTVVTALKALNAAQSGPEQPIPAAQQSLRVGSWGPKRAFNDCEDWQELLLLFPALKDRQHTSRKILMEHWKGRKTFSPLTYTEEPLEFVSQMAYVNVIFTQIMWSTASVILAAYP